MISFSRLGSMGRLSNQLFQIAATLGQAERTGQYASFPLWKYEQYFEQIPRNAPAIGLYKEPSFEYMEIPAGEHDLVGYFQSPKYFGSTIPRFKEAYRKDQGNRLPSGEKIAIHIRRGDYVGHEAYYQLQVTYYIQALMTIPGWQTKPIIFFSDDMGYAKTHFECLPNAYFIRGTDIEHMAMMSCCDHHILSNSSYSWWGAYLSEQKNVIYPSEYFRGSYGNKSTRDLWPGNWHSFDVNKDLRLDCSDMTFTIPVNHDHHDRKKNLDLALCHLQKYIKAEYIVGECLSDSFGYMSQYAKYVRYDYSTFHRTKMLNQMAEAATTPFIANWDCDILIPPLQIWLTCEMLRNGAQMVYPYDGRFARMDRFPWFKKIESFVDIGITSDEQLSGRAVKESVGGAVCWNKEAFTEYGCENEHMVSYAPEDVERYERAFKLGCKIDKVGGVLYHMDHFKGPDSSNRNPFFIKSKALLETYRKMTADELRKEVDKWPWRHQYTADYYLRFLKEAQTSAQETYKAIDHKIHKWPDISIIDIGCGIGEWALGNPNYIGVDYGINKKQLLIKEDQYVNNNLEGEDSTRGFKYKEYDLCLCLEVAEHIKECFSDRLIKYLCNLSETVLFSAAIPSQGGTGHCNEQWQTYWAEKFYANGFGAEVCYPVKDNPNVSLWYRQNMILYKRGATGKVYNFVLPEYYDQIILHRDNQIQELSDRYASLQKHLSTYK